MAIAKDKRVKRVLKTFPTLRMSIRDEIGESRFCVLVDESRDISKKEQMSVVVRFVSSKGTIMERFLGLVQVENTAALTLKMARSSSTIWTGPKKLSRTWL